MPLPGPTHIPPIGEQTDPDKVRVAAVVGGQLASAPARGFGLTAEELTALQTLTAQPVIATAETRSRIVNGAMQISQETGDGPVASGAYVADQWIGFGGGASSTYARTRPAPSGSDYISAVCNPGAALAAGSIWDIRHPIEGIRVKDFLWGTANAKQVILRFTAWTNTPGTYTAAIRNGDGTRSYLAAFTLAASTHTTITLVIPGDTTGTWVTTTAKGMEVGFGLAMGSNFQGVAGWQAGGKYAITGSTNGGATTGNQFIFYNVGLYCDPLASGVAPAWTMPDEAQELAACQRYWQTANSGTDGYSGAASMGWSQWYYFKGDMRTTPAMTSVNTYVSNAGAIGFAFNDTKGFRLNRTVTAAGAFAWRDNWTANARM